MSGPLYKKVIPIPEQLKENFLDYKEIEVVLEDVNESFYRDTLRGAIRVTLIPNKMEIPCEIMTVVSGKYPSLEEVFAFVDRLAANEKFLIDSLEGCVTKGRNLIDIGNGKLVPPLSNL